MATIWMDGEFVGQHEAKVSVYDHGLLYGDGVFEGIRAYGGRVFKMQSHLRRLFESAERIRLSIPYTMSELEQALRDTVRMSGKPESYIRLVVTRGVGTLGLNPFTCPMPSVFIICDSIQLYPPQLYDTGMKIIVAKRPRVPVACLDPAVKSLNYLNNILAKIESIDAGVLEAIMLNTDGMVAECTGDNIFLVKDGTITTPPPESGLLNGITRRFVLDTLCPALGLTCSERVTRLDDVYAADEVFLTGTAAEVIGVSAVGDRQIGSPGSGPITRCLKEEFHRRVVTSAPED